MESDEWLTALGICSPFVRDNGLGHSSSTCSASVAGPGCIRGACCKVEAGACCGYEGA